MIILICLCFLLLKITQEMAPLSGCQCWARGTYLCEDAELVQGTLGGHGGGAGKAGGGRGIGCGGRRGGMVALLDQVGEVVDAASKAIPVRVLCGVMVMVVVMMMVGAGGVVAQARA